MPTIHFITTILYIHYVYISRLNYNSYKGSDLHQSYYNNTQNINRG